jgi:hypothetical protein
MTRAGSSNVHRHAGDGGEDPTASREEKIFEASADEKKKPQLFYSLGSLINNFED